MKSRERIFIFMAILARETNKEVHKPSSSIFGILAWVLDLSRCQEVCTSKQSQTSFGPPGHCLYSASPTRLGGKLSELWNLISRDKLPRALAFFSPTMRFLGKSQVFGDHYFNSLTARRTQVSPFRTALLLLISLRSNMGLCFLIINKWDLTGLSSVLLTESNPQDKLLTS